MKIELGSVVVGPRNEIGVIVGHKPQNFKYPWLYRFKAEGCLYKAGEGDFKAVLGKVDLTELEKLTKSAPTSKPAGIDDPRLVPNALQGLKVGDKITVHVRGQNREAIYRGYFPNRPRFPLSFELDGRTWKAPVTTMVQGVAGKPAVKRPEADIIKDIRNVYCNLSPENLTCDGELPPFLVRTKRVKLQSQLKALFGELGREMAEDDVFVGANDDEKGPAINA